MTVYRGLASISLDGKGRFAMPTRYRDSILEETQGQLVVTIDTEMRCLLLYTRSQWEPIEVKLQQLPSFDPQARRIQRLLIGHATDVEMDNLGRVRLPSLLREYAGITKQIILLGQGNKFECWDEAWWQQCRAGWLEPSKEPVSAKHLEHIAL